MSEKRDIVSHKTLVLASEMIEQDGAVLIPGETTLVFLDETAERQNRRASLQQKHARVRVEAGYFDIDNVGGGSRSVRSGHFDHRRIAPNRFAQVVRKTLLAREVISRTGI